MNMLGNYVGQDCAQSSTVSWRSCRICDGEQFKSPKDFASHLKMVHCRKEGGSYICTYGPNSLCKTLPLEGVCSKDYDTHILRFHVAIMGQVSFEVPSLTSSEAASLASSANRQASNSSLQDMSKVTDSSSGTGTHQQTEEYTGMLVKKKAKERWTVYHAKVNLASLLNDPRPGRRQPDFFSKTWGVGWDYLDLTPSPDIPEIQPKHFKRYQKAMLPRLIKHQKNQANPPDVNVPIDAFPPLYTRAHDKASSDVGRVPSIFHSSSFALSDIEMFSKVFPWEDIEKSRSQSKRLLQEKLSHYLDIIEVQIARQVALKSEAFFHVMSTHEELQSRLASSTSAIVTLRSKMKNVSNCLVENPLSVLVKARKKQRLQLITRKLHLMTTLHQTQPTVQQLLASSDYVGALDIISTAREVLDKELTGIQSFRHLGSQLAELEKAINQIVAEEFYTFVTKDLNRPLMEDDENIDEDKFTAVFMGLLRQQSLHFLTVYKDEATATIKAKVKQTVIEYVSAVDSGSSENNTAAGQMRSLNFNSWLLLMEDIFHHLIIIVQRVKTLCVLMRELSNVAAGLDITTDAALDYEEQARRASLMSDQAGGPSIITEMFADKISRELKDLLIRTCEQANERCSKVISARSKDMFIEKLSSHEFFTLMSSVERFSKACETMCGSKISTNSVRGCLQGYNIRFINKFHEERKNHLNLMLDNERWRAADIPRDLQSLLTHCELCEQLTTVIDESSDRESTSAAVGYVTVSNNQYVIVGTVVSLLKMLLEYCTCLEDLPKSAPDILTKLTEILKIFNSRSSQLVLGAGALQLVGLKTISAKNLALLQRSLELVLYYIPIAKRQFLVYLTDSKSAMLRHFDSLIGEYNQHITIVRQKLRALAEGMIDACVSQWEIRAPMPSICFRTLCKQVKKFYEAICDVIEPYQLQQLFREVNTMVKSKLKDRLAALNIAILTGPQQGLVNSDIAYFTQNVSSLQSSSSSSNRSTTVRLTLTLNDIIVSR